jgi:predicted O-methyltransferase YrrM
MTDREIFSANHGLHLNGIESSYKEAGYGSLFYSLVRIHKPRLIVELGTYLGYSGLHMAAALRDNGTPESRLCLIDLWDTYPYRHCPKEQTEQAFRRNGLLSLPHCKVEFTNADAGKVAETFADGAIDLMHIDISNDGEKMTALMPVWEKKLSLAPNALIVMEGGSQARDRVEWMTKYNKAPLRPWLESSWVMERFSHFTFEPFPSLTLLRRRP